MPWYYHVCSAIVRVLLFLTTRCQIRGRENIPSQGPLLVVANHLSLADPPLLNMVFHRQVRFMAKSKLFRFKPFGSFMRGLGAFPIHRGRPDMRAFRHAEQVLTQGLALVIFPEGRRSPSGHLGHAFPGPARIALRSGASILPVGIAGTENLEHWPRLFTRPRVTVNIGRPFHLPPTASELTKTELINYVVDHIAELLPPEYRGTYGRQEN